MILSEENTFNIQDQNIKGKRIYDQPLARKVVFMSMLTKMQGNIQNTSEGTPGQHQHQQWYDLLHCQQSN